MTIRKAMQTIEHETMNPSWEAAVQIYMAVLQNAEASTEAVDGAKQEILRVARIADAFHNAIQHESKSFGKQ